MGYNLQNLVNYDWHPLLSYAYPMKSTPQHDNDY